MSTISTTPLKGITEKVYLTRGQFDAVRAVHAREGRPPRVGSSKDIRFALAHWWDFKPCAGPAEFIELNRIEILEDQD